MANGSARKWKLLAIGAVLYAGGFLIHSGDHARRGYDLTPDETIYAGFFSMLVGAFAVYLALRRHPLAPPFAIFVGFGNALGLSLVHFPPDWGPFSQPLRDGVDAMSWLTLAMAIGGALAFGLIGLRALRPGEARRVAA